MKTYQRTKEKRMTKVAIICLMLFSVLLLGLISEASAAQDSKGTDVWLVSDPAR